MIHLLDYLMFQESDTINTIQTLYTNYVNSLTPRPTILEPCLKLEIESVFWEINESLGKSGCHRLYAYIYELCINISTWVQIEF